MKRNVHESEGLCRASFKVLIGFRTSKASTPGYRTISTGSVSHCSVLSLQTPHLTLDDRNCVSHIEDSLIDFRE